MFFKLWNTCNYAMNHKGSTEETLFWSMLCPVTCFLSSLENLSLSISYYIKSVIQSNTSFTGSLVSVLVTSDFNKILSSCHNHAPVSSAHHMHCCPLWWIQSYMCFGCQFQHLTPCIQHHYPNSKPVTVIIKSSFSPFLLHVVVFFLVQVNASRSRTQQKKTTLFLFRLRPLYPASQAILLASVCLIYLCPFACHIKNESSLSLLSSHP